MYSSTMKCFLYLVIILSFTSGKSLAGLFTGPLSDKYEEFSIVKAAVTFLKLFLNLQSIILHQWPTVQFPFVIILGHFLFQNL